MATPGQAPITVALENGSRGRPATHELLAAMLRASERVSDLIFSPGRAPQVEIHGQLIPVEGVAALTADDTRRIAALPDPVGAVISTSWPAAISGQAWACTGVGSWKRERNQASTTGWNIDPV